MSHVGTHHCGTAGEPRPDKQITIYQGSVLNYAVKFFPEGMREYGIPEWAIEDFQKFLWQKRAEIVEKLVHMGIPYTYHQRHPDNR